MKKDTFQDFRRIKKSPVLVELKKTEYKKPKEKNNFHYTLWLLALVSVVFLFFALSFILSKAQIDIVPKTKDFDLNKDFTATKNSSTENLSYDTVVLSGEESEEIQAGEEKEYTEPATGIVLIYNAFSSSPQSLSEDTRLEGSNGKIYKTKEKVVVPGMAKGGVPGKVRASIYASENGEEYNSSPLDFKIFGFKGSPKYSKFYARSVGDITGGIKGKARKVGDEEKEKALNETKEKLFSKLFQKARVQTPENFVLFKDANFLNIEEENIGSVSGDGKAIVKVKGTLYQLLFNEKDFSKRITDSLVEEKDKENVFIMNFPELKFSLENKDVVTFTDAGSIRFNLSGNFKIVWKVDQSKIMPEILGENKSNFEKIMLQYPNIASINLSIKPIWRNSIPEKEKRVKIIVNYPK